MDHQEVMTVGTVRFNGNREADRMRVDLIQNLYPEEFHRNRSACLKRRILHFAELENHQRRIMANYLRNKSIVVHISAYAHDGNPKSHEQRFSIYQQLALSSLRKSVEDSKEVHGVIAKQGGWQVYQDSLIQFFEDGLTESRRHFQKYDFKVKSAIQSAGVQIADFYTSAARWSIFSEGDREFYTLVENQVFDFDYPTITL